MLRSVDGAVRGSQLPRLCRGLRSDVDPELPLSIPSTGLDRAGIQRKLKMRLSGTPREQTRIDGRSSPVIRVNHGGPLPLVIRAQPLPCAGKSESRHRTSVGAGSDSEIRSGRR